MKDSPRPICSSLHNTYTILTQLIHWNMHLLFQQVHTSSDIPSKTWHTQGHLTAPKPYFSSMLQMLVTESLSTEPSTESMFPGITDGFHVCSCGAIRLNMWLILSSVVFDMIYIWVKMSITEMFHSHAWHHTAISQLMILIQDIMRSRFPCWVCGEPIVGQIAVSQHVQTMHEQSVRTCIC